MVGWLFVLTACSDTVDTSGGADVTVQGQTTIVQLEPRSPTEQTSAEAEADANAGTATATEAAEGEEGAEADRESSVEDGASGSADAAPTTPWPELALALGSVVELSQPTALAVRPGSDDLWLAERAGRVRRVERSVGSDGGVGFSLVAAPVLDISSRVTINGERGLLGLAFSTDGRLLYLHYSDSDGDNVIAEFPMDGDRADPDRERVLLRVDQPFSNHNGGDLQLGPDGLLYVGLGDGGSRDDPDENGQDRTTLLGSVLRIDPRPTGGAPYTVPPDNPFAGTSEGFRPEIWVWGARNPWRFSFDALTGDLWIADVGQDRFEEINLLPASEPIGSGPNLGWNLMEGNEPFAGDEPPDHVRPVYVYPHRDDRCSVTGGFVYRGSALPELDGVYLFGDVCGDTITGLGPVGDGTATVADFVLDRRVERVIAFGQGPSGELYVLEQGGQVSILQRV